MSQGATGLSEAVEAIKKRRKSLPSGTSKSHHYPTPPVKHVGHIASSLSDIAELTRQVNLLSDQLNWLSEKNGALRDQLGLGAEEQGNLTPLRLRKRNELEALKVATKNFTTKL